MALQHVHNLIVGFVKESKLRNIHSDLITVGWGNGYVMIPPEHVWYMMDGNYINHYLECHGGITYFETMGNVEHLEKFCSTATSVLLTRGLDKNNFEKYVGYKVIGFDTAHAGDDESSWSEEAVHAETRRITIAAMVAQCIFEGMDDDTIGTIVDAFNYQPRL